MGIGSFLKKCGSTVCSSAKAIKNKTCEGSKKVGKAIASGMKSCTGKKKFDEAKKLLAEIKGKADSMQKDFDDFAEQTHERLCAYLQRINAVRTKLQKDDFQRFLKLTLVFAEWKVDSVSVEELVKTAEHKVGEIRSGAELFTIDFDNNPIKENLKAVFTLGFLTRKQARDTLKNVQEEEQKIKVEQAKIDAEKKRMQLVCDSLAQVVEYIESLHGLYASLLDELDYAVHFVRSSYFLHSSKFMTGRFDVYHLPERHLLCLMACEKMTRIMFSMSQRRYFDESLQLHETDVEAAREDYKESKELEHALAA